MSINIEGTREGALATDLSQPTTQHHTTQDITMDKSEHINELLSSLRVQEERHVNIHEIWAHGPRGERLYPIEPDPKEVLLIEALIDLKTSQLVVLGYSPAPLPDEYDHWMTQFRNDNSLNNKGDAPF